MKRLDAALEREVFRSALAAGRGSVFLDSERHPEVDRDALLLEACVTNVAWDQQVEGPRGPWLAELLLRARAAERLAPRIFEALSHVGRATRTGGLEHEERQVFDIVVAFARAGIPGARAAFEAPLEHVWTIELDAAALWTLELNGRSALAHVARQLATHDGRDGSLHASRTALEHAERAFGVEAVDAEIEHAARTDASVRDWKAKVLAARQNGIEPGAAKTRWAAERERRDAYFRALSFDELRRRPRTSHRGTPMAIEFWHRTWGRVARPDELELAFEALRAERDPERLVALFSIFVERDLPRLDSALLESVDHAHADVADAASKAFERLAHDEVRARGLARVRSGRCDEIALRLLRARWCADDAVLVLAALPATPERGEAHDIGWELGELAEQHADAMPAGLFEWIYRTNPCSRCRAGSVERLEQKRAVPSWMHDELAWDVNDELRELARRVRGTPA